LFKLNIKQSITLIKYEYFANKQIYEAFYYSFYNLLILLVYFNTINKICRNRSNNLNLLPMLLAYRQKKAFLTLPKVFINKEIINCLLRWMISINHIYSNLLIVLKFNILNLVWNRDWRKRIQRYKPICILLHVPIN
jgi:hypothetical protein